MDVGIHGRLHTYGWMAMNCSVDCFGAGLYGTSYIIRITCPENADTVLVESQAGIYKSSACSRVAVWISP